MRLLTFLEFSALFAGGAGMIAGRLFTQPQAFHFGLFLIGAALALGGLESIFARRMSFRTSSEAAEAYAGAPAIAWGLMVLVLGAAAIAAAYLMEQGAWRSMLRHLLRRPGLALGGLGLVLTCAGIMLISTAREWRGSSWAARGAKAIIGLALALGGVASIALGAWEWFEPRAFERFIRGLQERYDWRFLEFLHKAYDGIMQLLLH